ncbi:MAG: copper-binding protein [Thermoanaerobaculia bacterium]
MRHHSFKSRFTTLIAVGAVLALAACSRRPEVASGPVESYAMRGEIARLPRPGEREIVIRHEAVPGFRDEGGKVVGMEAMTMPFTLAPDLPASMLDGLAPGDRIAFTLEMRWQDPRDIARLARLEKLPAGTALSWDPPPASGAPAAPGTTGSQPQ